MQLQGYIVLVYEDNDMDTGPTILILLLYNLDQTGCHKCVAFLRIRLAITLV